MIDTARESDKTIAFMAALIVFARIDAVSGGNLFTDSQKVFFEEIFPTSERVAIANKAIELSRMLRKNRAIIEHCDGLFDRDEKLETFSCCYEMAMLDETKISPNELSLLNFLCSEFEISIKDRDAIIESIIVKTQRL